MRVRSVHAFAVFFLISSSLFVSVESWTVKQGDTFAGAAFALINRRNRFVLGWGDNVEGQVGIAETQAGRWRHVEQPRQLTGWPQALLVDAVAAGKAHTIFLSSKLVRHTLDGEMWASFL